MAYDTTPSDDALSALAADWPDWSLYWSSRREFACAVRHRQLPPNAPSSGLYRTLVEDTVEELQAALREQAAAERAAADVVKRDPFSLRPAVDEAGDRRP